MQQKIVHVDSKAFPVEVIFKDRYEVDFYENCKCKLDTRTVEISS